MPHKIALKEYKDFIACDDNKNKISYANVLELLCETWKVSILCYYKFTRDIPKIGCKLNLHNLHAANKIINPK